jgi:hypothetical protein
LPVGDDPPVVVPTLLDELGRRGFGIQAALDDGRSPAKGSAC